MTAPSSIDEGSTASPRTTAPVHLDWIVCLRGVAALCVFAFHVWTWLKAEYRVPLGWLLRAGLSGVDLFFVLSGFVIAWPYVVRRQRTLSASEVIDFYQRRFFRIAPVYYATLAVALVLAAWGFTHPIDAYTLAMHVLFAQNFDPRTVDAVNGVYWTLPTEIHYYLLFPLLLRFAPLDRPLVIGLAGIAFALSYRWFTVWIGAHGIFLAWTGAYLPGRIDQFAAGFAAACAVVQARERGVAMSRVQVGLATLLAIATVVVLARPVANRYGWNFLLGSSLNAIAIGLALYCAGLWFLAKGPTPRPSRGATLLYAIGLASLSLYLWHTYVLDLAWQATGTAGMKGSARVLVMLATIPATIALSWLTYYWIERPFVALSKSMRWRGWVASLARGGRA